MQSSDEQASEKRPVYYVLLEKPPTKKCSSGFQTLREARIFFKAARAEGYKEARIVSVPD
jgi:hypothetical protein